MKITNTIKVPNFTPTHAVMERRWGMEQQGHPTLYTLDRVVALAVDRRMAELLCGVCMHRLAESAAHEFAVIDLPKKKPSAGGRHSAPGDAQGNRLTGRRDAQEA